MYIAKDMYRTTEPAETKFDALSYIACVFNTCCS